MTLALVLASGCGEEAATAPPNTGGQVRGLVLEVAGRSITELETLRVQDQKGKVWTFTSDEGFIGFTPAHLREHQLSGRSVLVTYAVRGSTMVAVDIAD